MFLIAALPSYLIRFNIFSLPTTLLELMIWIVFLVWIIANWERIKANIIQFFKKDNSKIKIRYPFDWEIILLLLISLLAAGIAGFSYSSLGIWKAYFFEPALLYIVVLNVFANNTSAFAKASADKYTTNDTQILQMKGVEKIILALAIGALAVSSLAIYQKITGQFIDNAIWQAAATRRVVSFFGYPNAVGLYLGPIVLILIGWFIQIFRFKDNNDENPNNQKTITKQISNFEFQISKQLRNIKVIFIALTIILSILSIYFAKSKGALVGVAAGLVVFGLLAGRRVRWATFGIVVMVIIFTLSYAPVRNLAWQTITFTSVSGQIRQVGWSDTWRMLKDGRLITGAGLANFQAAVAPFHTEGIFIKDYADPDFQRKLVFNEAYRTANWQPLEIYLYPHNIILNCWSELGLAGMLLFVWIIIKYLSLGISNFQFLISKQFSISNFKFINIGLICAMAVIIVHGLVDVPYFKNDLAVMFWLLVAMMSLISLQIREIKSPVG